MNGDAEHEERLTGGNMNEVVRIGDTVRRIPGPWTPTVHALLAWLCDHGAAELVPAAHGLDERGREVLDHVPGETGNYPLPAWLWSETALTACGRMLRRVHDASIGFLDSREGRNAVWQLPVRHPIEVVCHNDAAPYNTVFRDGLPVALIDWDTAAPGPRIRDLAYLAYRIVPFVGDAGSNAPTASDRDSRLGMLIAAYGMAFPPDEVIAAMAARIDELADFSERRADEAGRPELRMHAALYRADAGALRDRLTPRS